MEWIILCGCNTTSIWSNATSKSHFASITSNPLFTIVEESIVILFPIDQFGCFKASSSVTSAKSFLFFPRNGPPDAVRIIFSISLWCSPFRHWNIAACSLSTGKKATPIFSTNGIIICPAVTKVSLFAKAISFFALIASITGRIPIMPTTAATTLFPAVNVAQAINPSIPVTTFVLEPKSCFSNATAFASS